MTKEEILDKGEIPVEEASKLLEKAEQAKKGSLYCKVSEKGGISVYGLQRMPVTLYIEQWQRLLDYAANGGSGYIKNTDGPTSLPLPWACSGAM